ncbi:hypothetical protein G6011_06783 [Alternaria panax]|uniref:RING-type domain-containing protein n=1 Tax=Alternaria panax TaxID=48097 RepID=A0AAD4I5S8_9PLEO|nr:hypothetical protein G6011_06783 [Alternaria panax]
MSGSGPFGSNKRARYTPPQPDADTFATQRAFLDSLEPVPMTTVDQNDNRCPICWKPYGEAADPGYDNSEQPVRLRCNHTFGNKCLSSTFALPGTSTINLRPLAFGSGSRGDLLGQRLDAYYMAQAAGELRGYAGAFTKMLAHSRRETRLEVFGTFFDFVVYIFLRQHWGSVVQELQRRIGAGSGFHKITILENAMILDWKRDDSRALASDYGYHPAPADQIDVPSLSNDQGVILPQYQHLAQVQHLAQFQHLPQIQLPPQYQHLHPDMVPSLPPPTGPVSAELLKQQQLAEKMKKDRDEKMLKMLKAEKEMQERNQRHLYRTLGVELGRIYSEYLKDRTRTEEPGSEQKAASSRQNFVSANISVHNKNPNPLSFEIASLDRFLAYAYQVEEDNSDLDGDESDTSDDVILANLFLVITRNMCGTCHPKDVTVLPNSVPDPVSLWWTSSRKIPDDCPICHKILFHKGSNRRGALSAGCEPSVTDENINKAEVEKKT